MPFGFHNTEQTFQRLIDDVIDGLPFVYAYLDDLQVASPTEKEQRQTSDCFLSALRSMALSSIPASVSLGVPSLIFLGHIVDKHGICPLEEKLKTIQAFPAQAFDTSQG